MAGLGKSVGPAAHAVKPDQSRKDKRGKDLTPLFSKNTAAGLFPRCTDDKGRPAR
jgi:hypothetical protein